MNRIRRRTIIGASSGAIALAIAGGGVAVASGQVNWEASTNVCHVASTYSDDYHGNSYVDWTLRGYHMQWYVQKSNPSRLWRVFTLPGEASRLADGSSRPLPSWWADLKPMPSSISAIQCGSSDQPDS